jgi:hypothetical protein
LYHGVVGIIIRRGDAGGDVLLEMSGHPTAIRLGLAMLRTGEAIKVVMRPE